MDGKKTWKKIGFGILFVAACFIAMYILMQFHEDMLMVGISAALLLISAFLFMNAVFSDKTKNLALQKEEPVKEQEMLPSGTDGEFRLKITKHMKEMESTQKELIDVLKNQNTLIQAQIENLENEIYMLSEKQVNQTKSIIKYNKENARQLAISERETLEYVMMELKKAIEVNGSPAAARELPETESVVTAQPVAATVLEEVSEADLFAVSDLPGDDEYVLSETAVAEEVPAQVEETPVEEIPVAEEMEIPAAEVPAAEEMEIPEMPEDIDLSELFDIPELFGNPAEEPSVEEISAEEVQEAVPVEEEKKEEPAPAPAADPLAGIGGDPNAMMTPEDIAKLLESMGQ